MNKHTETCSLCGKQYYLYYRDGATNARYSKDICCPECNGHDRTIYYDDPSDTPRVEAKR